MSNEPSLPVQPRKSRHVWRTLLTLLAPFVLAALYIWYGTYAVDWLKASQFHPSSQLAAIERQIRLTPRGEQIFYATYPDIETTSAFNQSCQSGERTAAILGCYVGDRIYLYDVTNDELTGAMQVTAAHEMLHAAYHRLNPLDKQRVDAMITAEYEKIKDEPEIKTAMQYYTQAEPGAETDELHSIIGTTIGDLDPALEAYYKTYFTDRAAIVAMNTKYNKVFAELNDQATELQNTLNSEAPVIKQLVASYQADLAQLNLDIQSFNERANSGGFSSEQSFEAARDALMARTSAMNQRRATINARVAAFNAEVAALAKLSVRANELNQSINGVSAPPGV